MKRSLLPIHQNIKLIKVRFVMLRLTERKRRYNLQIKTEKERDQMIQLVSFKGMMDFMQ